MQNTHLDTNEVIIEYMTDAHGNKIKRLKPLFIKSEPDREYTQHIPSDDNLPAVPEENFTQKREVTVDSYSESISSNDESSDDRTVTADSDSSATSAFEETPSNSSFGRLHTYSINGANFKFKLMVFTTQHHF